MSTDLFRPAGYLTLTSEGLTGKRGTGYDYIMAGNGLFVTCENHLMRATIHLAGAQIRGLPELDPSVAFKAGPIPTAIMENGISWMMTSPRTEKMFTIALGPDGYRMEMPDQEGTGSSIHYSPTGGAVAEFHSHGHMGAFFSRTDNADEQGFRVYGVCGKLDRTPEMLVRVGIYGHFGLVHWDEIFDGAGPMIKNARDKEER